MKFIYIHTCVYHMYVLYVATYLYDFIYYMYAYYIMYCTATVVYRGTHMKLHIHIYIYTTYITCSTCM